MSALDHVSILGRLISEGERAMQVRSHHGAELTALADLADRVAAEFDAPTDRERVIDCETMIFATALCAAAERIAQHRRGEAAKFLRVLGVLMPDIRNALATAIEQRKRPLS